MRRVFCLWIGMAVVVSLICSGLALAGKGATADECIEKCNAAAKMIRENGLDAALREIGNKKGAFTWENSYVFCMSQDTGVMLAHPYLPKRMLGMHLNDTVDSNGKKYMREILETARSKGNGWVDFAFRLKNKNTFVLQVPEENVIVGAGYYDGKTFAPSKHSVSDAPVPRLEGKKAAVIVAFKGFEDNEFSIPMELFRQAGMETTVFSSQKGQAKGMYGIQTEVAHSLDDLNVSDFDAVVFVGGSGSMAFHNHPKAHAFGRAILAALK